MMGLLTPQDPTKDGDIWSKLLGIERIQESRASRA